MLRDESAVLSRTVYCPPVPDDVRATPTETIINAASLTDFHDEGWLCVPVRVPFMGLVSDPFLICFLFAANFLIRPGIICGHWSSDFSVTKAHR